MTLTSKLITMYQYCSFFFGE